MSTNTNCSAGDLVKRILEEIVRHPEDIKVTENIIGRTVDMEVESHPGDMPRVMGREGKFSKALIELMSLISSRVGGVIKIRFTDPIERVYEPSPEIEMKPDWNSANVYRIAADICGMIFVHPVELEIQDGDNCTSVIDIVTDSQERYSVNDRAMRALTTIFAAIGKANGRNIIVTVAPE